MHEELTLEQMKKEWHGSTKSYLVGFISSLILTLISFGLVMTEAINAPYLFYALVTLALVQAIFQLLFFLHLSYEPKPQWESLVFYFMLLVLIIIVIGTLWIMIDLNDRVMSHMNMEMGHHG